MILDTEKDRLLKKIKNLEKQNKIMYGILFGGRGKYGMWNCLDGYYSACWNKQIKKLKRLRK